jgi:hypothetical protein
MCEEHRLRARAEDAYVVPLQYIFAHFGLQAECPLMHRSAADTAIATKSKGKWS